MKMWRRTDRCPSNDACPPTSGTLPMRFAHLGRGRPRLHNLSYGGADGLSYGGADATSAPRKARGSGSALQSLPGIPAYKPSTAQCSCSAISSGLLPGGNVIGLPMRTVIFPGAANFLPDCFTSNNPSIRMGRTGRPRFTASSPIPPRNGFIFPSVVSRPSGKTSRL